MIKDSLFFLCGVCLLTSASASGATPAEQGHAEVMTLPAITPQGVPLSSAIGQLPDGRMIFATDSALWLHDSRFNETIPLPVKTVVYEVEGRPDGSILVAAANLMAIARPDVHGGWTWEKLRDTSFTGSKTSDRIWPVNYGLYPLAAGIAVIGVRDPPEIFAGWRTANGQWTTWHHDGKDHAIPYFGTGEHLYKLEDGRTLRRWTKGKWELDRALSEPITDPIIQLTELGGGRLRLITNTPAILTVEPNGSIRSWPHPTSAETPNLWHYIRSLPNGGLVGVDNQATIRFLKADGSLATTLDATTGLPPGAIQNLFVDRAGSVWVHIAGRIVRIDQPLHLTRFDRFNGLSALAVHCLIRYQGSLYAGTDAGIYQLEPGAEPGDARFQVLPGPQNRTTVFLAHQGQLLAGSTDGVYMLQGNRFELIPGSPTRINDLTPSRIAPDVVYAATHLGVRRLQSGPTGWTTLDPANQAWAQSFLQTGEHDWWMAGSSGALQHLRPAPPAPPVSSQSGMSFSLLVIYQILCGQRVVNDTPANLSDYLVRGGVDSLQYWGTTPVAAGPAGLLDLDQPDASSHLLDAATRKSIEGLRRLAVFSPSSPDRAWIALRPDEKIGSNSLGWQLREIVKGADQPRRILPADVAAVGEIHNLLAEENVLWVGGEHGLLRVELDGLPPPAPPGAPHLRSLGSFTVNPIDRTIPADHRTVQFEFSVPDIQPDGAVVYRTRLRFNGRGEWTDYGPLPSRELGHLLHGDYEFAVQARNRDGLESPVTTVNFRVAPPWWLSPAGILLQLVAIGLIGYLGVKAVAHRSRLRQRELEKLVKQSTVELRARESQLSIAKDQAETANRAKSAFLAAMSHELRTPLNAILGFAQILHRQEGLSAKGHDQLEVIDRNGQHLLGMINEVLDLSKIEADKMTLNPEPCSLRRLAAGLAETFEPRASEKGLTFRFELGPGVPQRVMADEAKLRQILINLLGNAVKFTPRGEVVLSLAMVGGKVRFDVRDTGNGIAPEDLASVFEPFQQGQSHRPDPDNEDPGSGLGLPISQRLVELMGGRIAVDSEVGRGSRFHFDLFFAPAADPAEGKPATRIVGYQGPRQRMLVVDDVATNRAVLREMLLALDFVVVEAATGAEALAVHAAQPVDAVLLDLHLPDIDGAEVARQLAATPTRPRLIAVSASVYAEDGNLLERAGCDAFVPKPVHEATLLDAIAGQLQLPWITTPIAPNLAAATRATSSRPPRDILNLELPPPAVLEHWLDLARRANLRKLDEQIDAAHATGTDAEFRRALHELVQQFRTSTIREILTAALERQASD